MSAVRILYCPTWSGYDERAASLAAEINAIGGHRATVTPGGSGQFDVFVGDELVFSKKAAGRFPESDEITSRL